MGDRKRTFNAFAKNFYKSVFLGISVAILSLSVGATGVVVVVNFTYIFILSLVTTNVVDLIYYLREKRREVKKMSKDEEFDEEEEPSRRGKTFGDPICEVNF